MSIRFSSLSDEEKEERLKRALVSIDPSKGFVNLYELFCEVNKDIVVSRKEFVEFVNSRSR